MLTLLLIRYLWDGQLSRDYCLDLRRVPFCVDQQVLRGEIKFSSHYSLTFSNTICDQITESVTLLVFTCDSIS